MAEWLPLPEALGGVASHLSISEDYTKERILHELCAGRIKSRGRTVEGWSVSPLPAAWRGIVDWTAGSLRPSSFSRGITYEVELDPDGLAAADLPSAPKGTESIRPRREVTRRKLDHTKELVRPMLLADGSKPKGTSVEALRRALLRLRPPHLFEVSPSTIKTAIKEIRNEIEGGLKK
jgi:hypothetical protein